MFAASMLFYCTPCFSCLQPVSRCPPTWAVTILMTTPWAPGALLTQRPAPPTMEQSSLTQGTCLPT